MKKSDFYFDLPEELIAQTPLDKRDSSRLLILDKESGGVSHKHFSDILNYLYPGDCLDLNDSRVLPARLIGMRETGGAVEVLLLRDLGDGVWECMTRPGKKTRAGTKLVFGDGLLTANVLAEVEGNRHIKFHYDGIFLEILERLGKMPLPPYIHEQLNDPERYQTVYSRAVGSAAAPTAGLHFTEELLDKIREKGVKCAFVTLHVGLGTFRPVKEENVLDHKMHSEYFEISDESIDLIKETKKKGGRIIAVGTTSCRTIESATDSDGNFVRQSGFTDIFIYPGYKFHILDALITNFQLPESTLIMLVSALAGRENTLAAYDVAIKEKYRFCSFGDAMFIN